MFLLCQSLGVILSIFITSCLFAQLFSFFFAFWSFKHESLILNCWHLKYRYLEIFTVIKGRVRKCRFKWVLSLYCVFRGHDKKYYHTNPFFNYSIWNTDFLKRTDPLLIAIVKCKTLRIKTNINKIVS